MSSHIPASESSPKSQFSIWIIRAMFAILLAGLVVVVTQFSRAPALTANAPGEGLAAAPTHPASPRDRGQSPSTPTTLEPVPELAAQVRPPRIEPEPELAGDLPVIESPAAPILIAQATAPPSASEETKTGDTAAKEKEGPPSLIPPNPYAQFIGLQIQLKLAGKPMTPEKWEELLDKHRKGGFDQDKFKNRDAALPLLTGLRMVDGFVAVMAKSKDDVRMIADEVESLALAIGLDKKDLAPAGAARKAALAGKWDTVIFELAFLQSEVMDHLNNGKSIVIKEPKTILVAWAGFLQACVYASEMVAGNMPNPDLSNYLRVGRYLKHLVKKQEELKGDLATDEKVKKCHEAISAIEQILDIPLDGTISREKVEEMGRIAGEALQFVITP